MVGRSIGTDGCGCVDGTTSSPAHLAGDGGAERLGRRTCGRLVPS